MQSLVFSSALIAGYGTLTHAEEAKPDSWGSVRFLVGTWNGTTVGKPGNGTVSRNYEFVLSSKFLHERNVSTYPPQEANKTGEVHEHWSFFSYDKKRKTIIFRQFHQESFVVKYVLNSALSTPSQLVFESEDFENLGSGWKARETYEIQSNDEFTETFELAPPDKPFETYSQNHFKRVQR